MPLIIGVDPGKNGGIVPLDRHGDPQAAILMPKVPGKRGGRTNEIDWSAVRLLMMTFTGYGNWIVALEGLAHVTPGMAGRGKSMGTMIGEYHLLREAIEAAKIPIREVPAITWQAAYGLNKGLVRRPAGSTQSMSVKEKAAHSRERRKERENRMCFWTRNEWPWAMDKFRSTWNMGTIAAAMIGRHQYTLGGF